MRIYLVRHGDAATGPGGGERVLTERGRDEVRRMARFLAGRGAAPAEIRHSVRERARETAEILAGEIGGETAVVEAAGLAPHDLVAPVADLLAEEERDMLLVGHLPHLDRLASFLLAGDEEAAFDLPTAGAICLTKFSTGHPAAPQRVRYALTFMVRPTLL